MDKFEQIIKQAIEGYEAPFDPQAWENVSNELGDSFEQMMKDSTSAYEAPYNPAAWDAVSSQLGPAYSAWKWIGGSAAAVALIAGISFFIDTSEQDNNLPTNHTSTEVIVHNSDSNLQLDEDYSDDNSSHEAIDNNEANDIIHPIDPDLNDHSIQLIENDGNNDQIAHNQSNNESADQHQNNVEVNVTDPNDANDQSDNNEQHSNNANEINDQTADQIKVTANFRMSADEVCVNDKCTFNANDNHPSIQYVWSFGDGTYSNEANPTHAYKKAGEYTVKLVIKKTRTHEVLASNTEMIVVNELPQAVFTTSQLNEGIPTITFQNKSFDSQVVLWNVKGLKQSTNEDFEYTFRKKGDYQVSLVTRNDYGCTNKATQVISIENDYNLLAPTAFTPDGDGRNDNFIPAALPYLNVPFTMTIMDKNGKLVYTTQNAFEPWDGRFTEDNTLAPAGSSYIWRVVLTNSNGEQEYYEGWVLVDR